MSDWGVWVSEGVSELASVKIEIAYFKQLYMYGINNLF